VERYSGPPGVVDCACVLLLLLLLDVLPCPRLCLPLLPPFCDEDRDHVGPEDDGFGAEGSPDKDDDDEVWIKSGELSICSAAPSEITSCRYESPPLSLFSLLLSVPLPLLVDSPAGGLTAGVTAANNSNGEDVLLGEDCVELVPRAGVTSRPSPRRKLSSIVLVSFSIRVRRAEPPSYCPFRPCVPS